MPEKPPFDPSKPSEAGAAPPREKPPFDPNRPSEAGGVASPGRDPSFSSLTEQAGVGVYNAATGLAGLPGDIGRAVTGMGGGYSFPEYSPGQVFGPALSALPGQKQLKQLFEPITGPVPEAQNQPEEWMRTFGEFLPLGWQGRLSRVLMPAVGAATAQEGAKQIGLSKEGQEWAKFAGAITPATMSYLWRTAPDRAEAAMNQLFKNARGNYEHEDVKALKIKLPAAQLESYRIADDLFQNHGMRGGKVADAINELAFPPVTTKKPMAAELAEAGRLAETGQRTAEALAGARRTKNYLDYGDISSIRARLAAIMLDFNNPHDQALARIAKKRIDDWLPQLGQTDVIAGDVKKATARLADARSDWWAAESLQELATGIYKGWLGGAHYSGQNIENQVRMRIASILKREKEYPSGQYTPKEIGLMEKAAVPGGAEQMARRISKMLPRHGAMAPIVGTLIGTATGHPIKGVLAGAGVGELAQSLENKLANHMVRDVQQEILNRSASRSVVRLPDQRIDLFSPAVLGRPQGDQSNPMKFDIMGNLISPAQANEATLRSLPESAARVERERKRKEAEAK